MHVTTTCFTTVDPSINTLCLRRPWWWRRYLGYLVEAPLLVAEMDGRYERMAKKQSRLSEALRRIVRLIVVYLISNMQHDKDHYDFYLSFTGSTTECQI